MRTFDTPRPITVEVSISVGSVHLIASKRGDTTVNVQPSDPAATADVDAADRATVDLSGRHLVVETEKSGGFRSAVGFSMSGSVEVVIELPEKSAADIAIGVGEVRADGILARTRVRTGAGPVHIDGCGECEVSTGLGDMSLNHASGSVRVKAGGDMRLEQIDGTAEIKNISFGDTRIGEVGGRLRVTAASGSISVDRSKGDLHARTASGDIDIGEVISGEVTLATAAGQIDVGVADGVPAWVDARTKFGRVHNGLEAIDRPDPSLAPVEIKARTSFGDIHIRRSSADQEQERK